MGNDVENKDSKEESIPTDIDVPTNESINVIESVLQPQNLTNSRKQDSATIGKRARIDTILTESRKDRKATKNKNLLSFEETDD